MSLLNCRISLQFSELEIKASYTSNCLIDIFYEDKKIRIKYPQSTPLIFTLNSPLKKDKNVLTFYLLIQKGKKLRKLAKGEINIYKKYLLLNKNLTFEKDIYLFTYRNQLDTSVSNTNPKNKGSNNNNNSALYPGRIHIKGQFFDSENSKDPNDNINYSNINLDNLADILNDKNELLKMAINSTGQKEKEKLIANVKQIQQQIQTKNKKPTIQSAYDFLGFGSFNNSNFDEEDEFKLLQAESSNHRQEIEEDLSDVSISIDSEDDSELDVNSKNIENVNYKLDDMISKLRKYFDENGDNLLPQEPEKLRSLLENLTGQVKNISETYSQNLQSMSAINKRLKFQAKDYYDRYKELKENYEKDKKEFLMKNKVLECEDKLNKDENEKINKEIDNINHEINFFNEKLGLTEPKKDEETEIMLDILRSLKEKNVNIYDGLSKVQIDFLDEMMKPNDTNNNITNTNNNNNDNNKGSSNINNNDNDSNDSAEGEKYAKAIEDIANKIYSLNLIPDIKIEQIENNVYAFNDQEVTLKFDKDKLKLLDGTDLEAWIINSFKLPQKQVVQKRKPNQQKNNSMGGAKKK